MKPRFDPQSCGISHYGPHKALRLYTLQRKESKGSHSHVGINEGLKGIT